MPAPAPLPPTPAPPPLGVPSLAPAGGSLAHPRWGFPRSPLGRRSVAARSHFSSFIGLKTVLSVPSIGAVGRSVTLRAVPGPRAREIGSLLLSYVAALLRPSIPDSVPGLPAHGMRAVLRGRDSLKVGRMNLRPPRSPKARRRRLVWAVPM